jgi:inhibitor of cysteine peptidase
VQTYPQFNLISGGQRELQSMDAQTLAPSATTEYSTTNIQVEGVDEADIVKSDGEFLYVVSGSTIYILKAYPTNQAEILSKIELNITYGAQIYLNNEKLVVLGNHNWYYTYGMREEIAIADQAMSIGPYIYNEEMFVKVYDISNKSNPILSRTVLVNGTLSGSRMIGDYIYVVINQPILQQTSNLTDLDILLPTISGDYIKEIQPTEIRYVDVPDYYYRLTSIIAVNVMNDTKKPTHESFLAGQTTTMYVSMNNMYLVVPNTNIWILRNVGNDLRDETLIYRIKLDQENIIAMGEGSVSGFILNQFSMDEYNNFFRVATTEWTIEGSINNLFIMDMNMSVVGKIEGLAEGERVYSARFMGDRCYLVTFRQIDPFFVIDVANPTGPSVLGYLKIPGFSGYLHPFDENHIIGIGKEDSNLKLSLFDVTDVSMPTETAKYPVNAEWSDSMALWDHKAFLFDKSKQLLALPVSINYYATLVPGTYWQGAYIFDVSLEQGFTLEGTITHKNPANQYDYGLEVRRILYIDNVLYTVSEKLVKINDLETLDSIVQIELS